METLHLELNMQPDPTKMTPGEVDVFLVTEICHIKADVKEIKDCVKDQPNVCDKKYVTSGGVYGILLKCLIGISAIGGVIFAGVKIVAAAIL